MQSGISFMDVFFSRRVSILMHSVSLILLALWILEITNTRRLAKISEYAQTAMAADTIPQEQAADAPLVISARDFFAQTAAVSAAAETLSPAAK